jgi:lipopolysaccharide transport system permease protein
MMLVGISVVVPLAIASGKATLFGLGVLLPTVTLLFVVLISGICYVLAAVGVFLRDVREVVGFLLSIGLFLHPILYPPQNVPGWLNELFALSPFSHLIWCFRDALVHGAIMHPISWIALMICALVSLVAGWRIFAMLQPTFGNAL